MPTYTYECSKSGERFERSQGMREEPLSICPTCGAPVERVIVPGTAMHFRKGGARKSGGRKGAQGHGPSCGRDTTCCGRATPCATKPCGEGGH